MKYYITIKTEKKIFGKWEKESFATAQDTYTRAEQLYSQGIKHRIYKKNGEETNMAELVDITVKELRTKYVCFYDPDDLMLFNISVDMIEEEVKLNMVSPEKLFHYMINDGELPIAITTLKTVLPQLHHIQSFDSIKKTIDGIFDKCIEDGIVSIK